MNSSKLYYYARKRATFLRAVVRHERVDAERHYQRGECGEHSAMRRFPTTGDLSREMHVFESYARVEVVDSQATQGTNHDP